METEHFINEGFGWTCKRCRAEEGARGGPLKGEGRARFFDEGEAEAGGSGLAAPSMARWRDSARGALYCPRCGVEEDLSPRLREKRL